MKSLFSKTVFLKVMVAKLGDTALSARGLLDRRSALSTFSLACLLSISSVEAAESIIDHPGYVDFTSLSTLAGVEPTVEISLKSPLLRMINNFIGDDEREAANFISNLARVSVKVFPSDLIDSSEVAASMADVADDLDARGWERVVRVREDGDYVDIYFRLSDQADMIYGIAVMVAEPSETVLVNIVGDISVDDLTALGRRFDIDELVDIEISN